MNVRKMEKLNEKYKPHENLIIVREARKTIRYIEKKLKTFQIRIEF